MIGIHEEIRELVTYFRSELETLLMDKFYGLYLYNSVAMGKFEPKYSDMDFMVVINAPLTDNEVNLMAELHEKMKMEYKYGDRIDCMYIQFADLGKTNRDMKPYPYVAHSDFHREGYFDINYVTWWGLKEYDMAVDSPSLRKELSHINWDGVLHTMSFNLNHYWAPKLNNPENFKEDIEVEFAVMTLSRIVYTLKESRLTSKSDACKFVLKDLPQYGDIMKEALAIRDLKPLSVIGDVCERRDKTVEFLTYMIDYGNGLLEEARK
ncbi:aminoglycoside adenylyltransferase domain-containing protein [Alkaliphilus hydrothermalis]|uniref:Adenylyltransferase AadA C-terminal domain-containing protein n=1 Tax=Alkaliphilus hydrothermalis TaxID=1482730 RepID=A0ABS2NLV2_9FIRM|nr:aminoglycoside adenylyltransferase domain-containing protein [Alkaliphilus hydrothermalis]MBM7613901.1 hypothetical protein [Alkaliphilus hydrothermalis]